jgi:hypothetical protein
LDGGKVRRGRVVVGADGERVYKREEAGKRKI